MQTAIQKGSRVPGTARRDQLRAISVREARARDIWVDVFESWSRILTVDLLRDAYRGGGLDVIALASRFDAELARRRDQLERSLTNRIVRADLDDFTTGIGPLTAETLARNQIGDLVVELSKQNKAKLRQALVHLFADGPTDDVLHGLSRAAGLTSRQLTAVQNLRRRLIQDGAPSSIAVTRSREYAGRLMRRRARLIARTESVRFTSAIVEARAIEVGGLVKQWVSARDGEVESICISLDNGSKVEPKGVFVGEITIGRPPAHPGCRCVLELSRNKPGPGRKRPRRRPTRRPSPRPPPTPREPAPPRARPAGDARTAAQVGGDLEAVGGRFERIIAETELRRRGFRERMAVVDRERGVLQNKLDEIGRKVAPPGPPDLTPHGLSVAATRTARAIAGTPELAKLARLENESLRLSRRMFAAGLRAQRLHEKKSKTVRKIVGRAKADRNAAQFVDEAVDTYAGALDDFRGLVSNRWLPPPGAGTGGRPIPVMNSRGGSFQHQGSILIRKDSGAEIISHELGHAIEERHREVLEASVAFLRGRTAGEGRKTLAELLPGRGYGKDVFAWEDKFIHPYVGRDYGKVSGRTAATEVLSMGLEYMHKNALFFWREDPEHFAYIWDIMRGRVPTIATPGRFSR